MAPKSVGKLLVVDVNDGSAEFLPNLADAADGLGFLANVNMKNSLVDPGLPSRICPPVRVNLLHS